MSFFAGVSGKDKVLYAHEYDPSEWIQLQSDHVKGTYICIHQDCPNKGNAVHPKKLKIQGTQFFSHYPRDEKRATCGGIGESKEHRDLKFQILKAAHKAGYSSKPEYKVAGINRRADVFVFRKTQGFCNIVVEVQKSSQSAHSFLERTHDYIYAGIYPIWIYLKKGAAPYAPNPYYEHIEGQSFLDVFPKILHDELFFTAEGTWVPMDSNYMQKWDEETAMDRRYWDPTLLQMVKTPSALKYVAHFRQRIEEHVYRQRDKHAQHQETLYLLAALRDRIIYRAPQRQFEKQQKEFEKQRKEDELALWAYKRALKVELERKQEEEEQRIAEEEEQRIAEEEEQQKIDKRLYIADLQKRFVEKYRHDCCQHLNL